MIPATLAFCAAVSSSGLGDWLGVEFLGDWLGVEFLAWARWAQAKDAEVPEAEVPGEGEAVHARGGCPTQPPFEAA